MNFFSRIPLPVCLLALAATGSGSVVAQMGGPAPQSTSTAAQSGAPAQQDATQPVTAPAKPLAFDVVSVKPNKSGGMQMRILTTPDGLSMNGIPMHMILHEVFNLPNNRILGEPGWANTDRFDIEAKVAPEDAAALKDFKGPDRFAMLLPVLQDRFALKFHHETKDLTVYTLVIAKGGLKMKEADPNNTYPNGFKPPTGTSGAGLMMMNPGGFTGQAVAVDGLVRLLSQYVDGTVVDKTALTGKYDFELKFAQEGSAGPMMHGPDGGAPQTNAAPASMGEEPSIFAALEEQLGLKLVASKQPVDVIVIDHIEQPSAN